MRLVRAILFVPTRCIAVQLAPHVWGTTCVALDCNNVSALCKIHKSNDAKLASTGYTLCPGEVICCPTDATCVGNSLCTVNTQSPRPTCTG